MATDESRSFSYKGALHNLLGISGEPGTGISYARAPQPQLVSRPSRRPEVLEESSVDGFAHEEMDQGMEQQARPVQSQPYRQELTNHDATQTSEHDRSLGATPLSAARPEQVPHETVVSIPGVSARPQHTPAPAPEKQEARPVRTAEEGEGAAVKTSSARESSVPRPPQQRVEREAVTTDERRRPPAIEPIPARQSRVPRPREDAEFSTNGNLAAAAGIEQLRRTVKELSAKIAARQARTQDETPREPVATPAPQAPPAQRVVVMKQAAPRSGPPRAFWQRSYLGRSAGRTLR